MKTEIDTSFLTLQRDIFTSGMAAEIGSSAFVVWLAIKNHADYNNGECWPGMRTIAEMTGMGKGTVCEAVKKLIELRLLRITKDGGERRTHRYIARERLTVRFGNRVLCTVVVDYVPAQLRSRLEALDHAVNAAKNGVPTFSECEILPGEDFTWDDEHKLLRAKIGHEEFTPITAEEADFFLRQSALQAYVSINPPEVVDNLRMKPPICT